MQAVLYARFSPRPNAEECESIEHQLEKLRAYCAAHGYEILGEHADRDMSGCRADNRPGLAAALDQACKAKAVLIVFRLDRLARSTPDACNISKRLDHAGAELASLHEKIDTTSAMGRFVFRLMASLAELERETISERTRDAMRRHQAAGRRMCGIAAKRGGKDGTELVSCLPYGKQLDPDDDGRLVDEPQEQMIIARIREMAALDLGPDRIAGRLNKLGLRRRGRLWYPTQVRRLLARI